MKKIGWIGVGTMGKPMSMRLVDAGYEVTVYNRTPEKTKEVAAKGAKVAQSIPELAAANEVVFSMIADSPALEEVGALVTQSAKPGTVFIDMSTVSPEASARVGQACAEKGIKFLRAPVSGSVPLAASGTLGIMVSGDEATYKECYDILRVLGDKIFYLGPGEEARYMKLALNIMVAVTCEMLAEAVAWGEKAGLSAAKMMEVMTNSAVASPLVGYKVKPITERNFTALFTSKMMEKDLDMALEIAQGMGVPLPVTALTRQMLAALRATGRGDLDFSALLLLIEEMAGMKTA